MTAIAQGVPATKKTCHPQGRKTPCASRGWVSALTGAFVALALLTFSGSQAAGQTTVYFTTAGNSTWTCPVGVTSVQVEAWGGGGGGGGCGAIYTGAGGGAGGS
jgi:hypothetical protein